MIDSIILWLSLLIAIIGIAAIGGILWFAYYQFRARFNKNIFGHPDLDHFFHHWLDRKSSYDDIPRYLFEGYSEYLQRRNEFWTTYGQIIIAILIVTILSILLLTKTISAEAGLPILSGISGFAIAKGVSGAKTINVPQDRYKGQ